MLSFVTFTMITLRNTWADGGGIRFVWLYGGKRVFEITKKSQEVGVWPLIIILYDLQTRLILYYNTVS